MVLDGNIAWKIMAGSATQVRRVVDSREPGYRERRGRRGQSRQRVAPFVPYAGLVVPIQKPARKDGRDTAETFGYAKIVDHRIERHGAISFVDVRASGFRTTTDYKASWVRLRERAWVLRETARQTELLGFERGPGDAECALRFDTHHGDATVHVMDVEPVREARGRFLSADPAAMQADYVESSARAMRGELEAVDEEYLAKFVKENADKPKVTRLDVWREQREQIERRIRDVERLELGRDVRSTLRVLRRQLEILDEKVSKAA